MIPQKTEDISSAVASAGSMNSQDLVPKSIVYGAFKGMGDLLSAAPVIIAELAAGSDVVLLIFPQLREFVELLDFDGNRKNLRICILPVRGGTIGLRTFFKEMAPLSPDIVWVSPHAPRPAASWKVPLLMWLVKRRYWPAAKLAGAESEPLSFLFDVRVPVDRKLPFMLREWVAFSRLHSRPEHAPLPAVRFIASLQGERSQPRSFDLLIHPGAGADNRKWPVHHYVELLKHIPASYRIAIMGLRADVDALRAALPSDRSIQFLTGSLKEAIATIAHTRVALTMDSGTMFFANILGVPAVSLFGPSNPLSVLPPNHHITPVYDPKWPCQPCFNTRCTQKSLLCMNSIEPEKVANELLKMLQSAPQ
jgi:heptosyltransferase II